jgi:hypothetical protein
MIREGTKKKKKVVLRKKSEREEESLFKMRAWDTKEKKMYYFFDLKKVSGPFGQSEYNIKSFIKNFSNFSEIMFSYNFIDLKKNSIYQKDVVRCVKPIKNKDGSFVIGYGEMFYVDIDSTKTMKLFSKFNKRSNKSFSSLPSENFVVAGNIYSNPNLKELFQ